MTLKKLAGLGLAAVLVAAPAAAEPIKLKIASVGAPPSMHNIFMQVAYEGGFFAKNGIEADGLIQLRAGPLATQALSSGQIDVTETDAEGVLNAASSGGFAAIAVAAPAQHLSYVIAAQQDITSLKDLVGQPFAISRPGALSQYLLFPALEREKIARDAITWVSIGGASERRLALVAGRVKGALLHMDFALQAERDGKIHSLDQVVRTNPDYPHELIVVRKELVDKRPEVVTGIVRAVIEACRFIVNNRERTLDIYQKYTGDTDRALANKGYDALMQIHGYGVNGGMTEKGLQAATRQAVENGSIPKALPLATWADFRFQEEALKQLGTVPE